MPVGGGSDMVGGVSSPVHITGPPCSQNCTKHDWRQQCQHVAVACLLTKIVQNMTGANNVNMLLWPACSPKLYKTWLAPTMSTCCCGLLAHQNCTKHDWGQQCQHVAVACLLTRNVPYRALRWSWSVMFYNIHTHSQPTRTNQTTDIVYVSQFLHVLEGRRKCFI